MKMLKDPVFWVMVAGVVVIIIFVGVPAMKKSQAIDAAKVEAPNTN